MYSADEWYEKAERYHLEGDLDAVIVCCNEAIKLRSDCLPAWEKKGDALRTMMKFDESLFCFEKALELNQNSAFALARKGDFLRIKQQYDTALEHLNKALSLDPHCALAWRSKGDCLKRKGKLDEAIVCFDIALKLDSSSKFAWYGKAVTLFKKEQFEEANNCFDKAYELLNLELNNKTLQLHKPWRDQIFANILFEIGEVCRYKTQYDEAIQYYDKSLALESNSATTLACKGAALVYKRDFEAAVLILNKAIDLDSTYAFAWSYKGVALAYKGDIEAAILVLNKAIDLDSTCEFTWLYKGVALGLLKKFDAAIDCCNKALQLNDKYLVAYVRKYGLLSDQGKYDEALQGVNSALQLNDKFYYAWEVKGGILYEMHQYDEAIECLNKALALNPTSQSVKEYLANAWRNKAAFFYDMGCFEISSDAIAMVLSIYKNDAAAWIFNGAILARLGRLDAALECAEKALQINENPAAAWHFKSYIMYLKGQWNEALYCINKALKLGFNDQEVLIQKSNILMHHHLYDKALKCIDKYIHNEQDVTCFAYKGAWVVKGILYRKKELYDEAVSCFDKVLAIDAAHKSSLREKELTIAEKTKHFSSVLNVQSDDLQVTNFIWFDDLIYGEIFASGSYSDIHYGIWEVRTVAIKELRAKEGTDVVTNLNNEVSVMSRLRHPNIASFYGVYTAHNHCGIVMEYCVNGALSNWLRTDEALSWPLRIRITSQIAEGLSYIHECGFVHADLKSANVLLDERLTVKITDFGFAQINSKYITTKTENTKGTLMCVAPELLKSNEKYYTDKTDIYSFGVVVWEIAARKKPFQDVQTTDEVYSLIISGKRDTIPSGTPYSMASLIGKCWADRAEDRPAAKEAIAMLQDNVDSDKSNSLHVFQP